MDFTRARPAGEIAADAVRLFFAPVWELGDVLRGAVGELQARLAARARRSVDVRLGPSGRQVSLGSTDSRILLARALTHTVWDAMSVTQTRISQSALDAACRMFIEAGTPAKSLDSSVRYFVVGSTYTRAKDFRRAHRWLSRALHSGDPAVAMAARLDLGRISYSQEEYEAAEEWFERTAQQAVQESVVAALIASASLLAVRYRLEQWEEASVLERQVEQLLASLEPARNLRAVDDLIEAIRHFRRDLEMAGSSGRLGPLLDELDMAGRSSW